MDVLMQGGRITLPKEGLLALRDACGVQVKCVRGSLWVTQESDGIDHVLFPGQWVTIDHKGLSIVTALDAATVAVSARHRVEASIATPARPALARLADAIMRPFLPSGPSHGNRCAPAPQQGPWQPAPSGR